MLGVRPYADGGIVSASPVSSAGINQQGYISVPVTIENVTFDVQIDGNNTNSVDEIVRIMKVNIADLTDEIAYRIALSLQQTFANMPLV